MLKYKLSKRNEEVKALKKTNFSLNQKIKILENDLSEMKNEIENLTHSNRRESV